MRFSRHREWRSKREGCFPWSEEDKQEKDTRKRESFKPRENEKDKQEKERS
jgi:hypothetical protein